MAAHSQVLEAIQSLPGDTAGEKYCNISKVVIQSLKDGESIDEVIDLQELPEEVLKLYEVEAARLSKKVENIVTALKSEDALILNRVFKTSWFFDGSDLNITNPDYFSEHILPFVSLNTRLRIIKYLSINLYKKNQTKLAEEFFNVLSEKYGVKQALPLITACNADFAYKTIVDKKIVLSYKLVKILYRSKPHLIIKYFQLSCQKHDPYEQNQHIVHLDNYIVIFFKLIKDHLSSFAELFENNEDLVQWQYRKLSKKTARLFLKNGKHYLINRPMFYLQILPIEVIDVKTMTTIFPKLMIEYCSNIEHFDTNCMLHYLDFYPESEKCDFFVKTYEQCYGQSIFNTIDHVTPELMLILPPEKRIELARIKKLYFETNDKSSHVYYTSRVWRCYLPTNETFPEIKKEIALTSDMHERLRLITEMIYNCKVNQDLDNFFEILQYFEKRHKNEQTIFLSNFMNELMNGYNLKKISIREWEVLDSIIRRAYVKDVKEDCELGGSVINLLEQSIHFKLSHNFPIVQSIKMFVEIKCIQQSLLHWNILTDHPEYEKLCLQACIDEVEKKLDNSSSSKLFLDNCYEILNRLLLSVHDFHCRHLKDIEFLKFLSDIRYPALVEKALKLKNLEEDKDTTKLKELKESLNRHATNIYLNYWMSTEKELANVQSGAALVFLRRNRNEVMKHWSGYLESCKQNYTSRNVVRFIRSVRWYKDIPIEWLKQCQKEIVEEKSCEALHVLGALLDGHSFSLLVNPFLPSEHCVEIKSEQAKDNYKFVASIPHAITIVNPPIPLEVVGKLCQGDYLTAGLAALTNVSRRTSVPKVLSFAKELTCQRVSISKHGFRIFCMVGSLTEILQFLSLKWKTEDHYSIRRVIIDNVKEIFVRDPSQMSWNVLKQLLSGLEIKDEECLQQFCSLYWVPNDVVYEYTDLMFTVIDNFKKSGLEEGKVVRYTCSLIGAIDVPISNQFPEKFSISLIEKFFFSSNLDVSRKAKEFALNVYILPQGQKRMARLALFSNFFINIVSKRWNEPHPNKSHYFPINYTVNKFIAHLITSGKPEQIDLPLIEEVLKMFQTVINPEMDAQSFLLLTYAIVYLQSKSLSEFGKKIGHKITELVKIYSELFVVFMTQVLYMFVGSKLVNVENQYEGTKIMTIIEGLIESKNNYAFLMAAEILEPNQMQQHVSKYDKIVDTLLQFNHPAVTGILYSKINKLS